MKSNSKLKVRREVVRDLAEVPAEILVGGNGIPHVRRNSHVTF